MGKPIALVSALLLACSPALPAVGTRHPASPDAPASLAPAAAPTLQPTASVDEVVPLTAEAPGAGAHAHHHHHGGQP